MHIIRCKKILEYKLVRFFFWLDIKFEIFIYLTTFIALFMSYVIEFYRKNIFRINTKKKIQCNV